MSDPGIGSQPKFDLRASLQVGTASLRRWFWSHVDRSGSCWWWRGKIIPGGYAYLVVDHQSVPVARAAFMFAYGTIPANDLGKWALYSSCRRRLCVNPDHHALNELKRNGEPTGK